MSARYAVYYVPAPDHPLAVRAAAWLGRDAFTGERLPLPPALADTGLDLDALTEEPRRYGFHATLKAPFELAAEASETELLDFARRFADGRAPFNAAIAPRSLGRFLAFRLVGPSPEMQELHEACVRAFDPFRAPLGERDLARRRKAGLSPEEDAHLQAWGYPHVFEGFRFHMTLSGPIADPHTAERLLALLEAYFAELAGPHRFDGVAVFRQAERTDPFRVVARFPFRAAPET